MRPIRRAVAAVLLLHVLAGPLAAQRRAPPRFAPAAARGAPVRVLHRPAPSEDRFSMPLFFLSSVAGGIAGALVGTALSGGPDAEGQFVPAFLIGGALGFSVGATWYAFTH